MKSFNQHITKDREKLKDKKLKKDLNEKKDEKLEEDLTDILWAAGAGAGLFAIGKAWDKWGTEVVASLPFASDSAKAAAIDKKKEQKDKKIEVQKKLADDPNSSAKVKRKAEKELDKLLDPVAKAERATEKGEKKKGDTEKIEKGKLATGEYKTDDAGIIDNQGDAQKYRDATGSAPEDWATSDGKYDKEGGAAPKPEKGIVWSKDEEEKWKDDEDKRKEKEKEKQDAEKEKKGQGGDTETEPADTSRTTGTSTAPRRTIGTSHRPRGKMTITESNELQAIMALDDAGIKAEINRKGQVVIKKKDKKKAHRALEKSFTKGGWPSLKLEDVELDESEANDRRNAAINVGIGLRTYLKKDKWFNIDLEKIRDILLKGKLPQVKDMPDDDKSKKVILKLMKNNMKNKFAKRYKGYSSAFDTWITEESELTESTTTDKKNTFTMAPFEDLRSVADAALKIMTRQPQEVKEEEKEEVTKENQPQQLTEQIV